MTAQRLSQSRLKQLIDYVDLCLREPPQVDATLKSVELSALLQEVVEAREATPTFEQISDFLTKRRGKETRTEWLARAEELCREWGPIYLLWAQDEVRKYRALAESRTG